MLLADAVERWALANRVDLDESEKEKVRRMWSILRKSEARTYDVVAISPDESRLVMGLFDKSETAHVAATLNNVRRWVLERPDPSTKMEPAVAEASREGQQDEQSTAVKKRFVRKSK